MKEKTKCALLCRRALAIGLALVMCVTFIPLFSGTAHAAQTAAQTDEITVEEMGDIDLGEVDLADTGLGGFDVDISEGEDTHADAATPEAVDPGAPGVQEALEALAADKALPATADPEVQLVENPNLVTLTPDNSTGMLTVTGTVTDDAFLALYVDDYDLYGPDQLSGTSINAVIDMSQFDVGAHMITVLTYAGQYCQLPALTLFYDAPVHKQKQYETYSKYLFYSADSTYYRSDYSSGLYLDIKRKGTKKWKTYGPLSYESKVTGLKPNKTYQVRVYYGENVTVNGQNYFFNGTVNGKYKTLTIKTGKKKLPIRSVRAKAVKVRKYTHKRYGPATGLYLGQETWYTYRIKVTVKMKKKPGVKGIYINGKKVKGNKKSYSKTFSRVSSLMYGVHKVRHYKGKWWKQDDYYNIPRGKKYTAAIYSYSHKTYKAYSPIQKKKTRLK